MAEADPPATAYEKTDISLKTVGIAAIAVLMLLVAGPLALHELNTGLPDDVSRRLSIAPPAPQLEIDPAADLKALRAKEDQQLNSHGWIDRAHGIVHIPITEAMARAAAAGIDGFPRGTR